MWYKKAARTSGGTLAGPNHNNPSDEEGHVMAKAKPTTIAPERLRAIESRLLDNLRRTPSGCWEWTGKTNKDGYGSWGAGGFASLTHRVAYRLYCGDLDAGRCVCHTCDNPRCCHPAHLFIGSDLDNARDRDRKGRGPRGERNHFATITIDVARRIKSLLASGLSWSKTARECNVARHIVRDIAIGKSWAHV